MADVFLAEIQEVEKEFEPLYKRMDKTRDMHRQIEYKMRNLRKQPIKDVVNVTMNDARVFAEKTMGILNGTEMQQVIIGEGLADDDATHMEDYFRAIYYEIDIRLANRDYPSLAEFAWEQMILRGRLAARYTAWQQTDGTFVPDLLPCDSRFLSYRYNSDGLAWAAPWYSRTKEEIQRQYGKVISNKRGIIRDAWDTKAEFVYLNGDKISEKENTYGVVPFVIRKSGLGSSFQDEDNLKYSGEDIFANNRLLYDEISRTASILQTINYWIINGSYQYESEQGEGATKRDEYPAGSRKVFPVDQNGGYKLIPINDIRQATRLFWSVLMGAVQRGSFPNLDYGNLTFPLSAVAITQLTSSKDQILLPRIEAVSKFYRDLSRMIADQYVKGAYNAELGEEGFKKSFPADQLAQRYAIRYKFFTENKEQDMANAAMAAQIAPFTDEDYVRREVLKVRDPDGMKTRMRSDRAEKLNKALSDFRLAHSLRTRFEETGDNSFDIEAEMVLRDVESAWMQRILGEDPAREDEDGDGRTPAGSGLPLFAGGGGGGGGGGSEEEEPAEQLATQNDRRADVLRKSAEEG